MVTDPGCPTTRVLRQLMLGQAPAPEADALGRHLLACSRCAAAVEALEAEDGLVAAMRAQRAAVPGACDARVESLMKELSSHGPLAPPSGRESETDAAATPPPCDETAPQLYDFLAPPQEPGEIGRLGGYRVLGVVGAGGMGVVFRAEDPQLRRLVAIKAMKPALATSRSNHDRFLREARATAALEHDHVITIHQVGEDHGIPFLVMQYLQGETLASRVAREGTLPVAEVLRIGRQIAEGLAAAHERGLTHRDVKPANIFLMSGVSDAHPSSQVKLLDFGLARGTGDGADLTQTGFILGTPAYMSPEQAHGEATDARSDLFSLGCVLYELCTGRRPFASSDMTATPPHEVNPAVFPSLSAMVMKLLAKDRTHRYASAREVAAVLEACARDPATVPRSASVRRPWQARRILTGLVAAAIFLLAGAVIYVNTGQGRLIIEVHEPDVKVTIDGDEVKIKSPRDEVTIAAGRHVLKVTKDGHTTDVQEFTVRRGGKVELTARLTRFEPEELKPALPLPADLAALEKRIGGLSVDPADRAVTALRQELLAFRAGHAGTPAALQATGLMARLPWPADALRRERIPADELTAAGEGDLEQVPASLVAILGDSRLTHWAGVHCVAYSPDGKTVAAGGWESSVRLWDVATGRARLTLRGHTGEVWSVAYSPDGRTLASGSDDGTIRFWDTATGRPGHILRGHADWVFAVAFSRDGRTLASGGRDRVAKLWDVAGGKEVATLRGHADEVFSVAFAADGLTLFSACKDGTVKLWDTTAGKELDTLKGHAAAVRCLALSRDGQSLASGSWNGTVKLWDAGTRKERYTLRLPEGGVDSVAFHPDSRMLATGCGDGTIKLWDAASGEERHSLPRNNWAVLGLAFSPDGQTLAAGSWDYAVQLFDVATRKERHAIPGHRALLYTVAFSPDGQRLASASQDNTVRLWDVSTGQPGPILRHPHAATSAVFSPDGRTLATACHDGAARLWDAARGEERHVFKGHTAPVRCVALSPDGRLLATASWDGSVKLWNVHSGEEQRTLLGQAEALWSVAFSPDGLLLAAGSANGTVVLWDVATGQRRQDCHFRGGTVYSLAFSPDGQVLGAAYSDGAVKLWDASAGRERPSDWVIQHPPSARSVAFSPDGRALATAGNDGSVRLWDARTGKQQQALSLGPPRRDVYQATFSPDGRHLATANGNGTVYVLRLAPLPAKGQTEAPSPAEKK